MKRFMVVMSVLVLVLTASYVSAEGLYVGVSTGITKPKDATVTKVGVVGSATREYSKGVLIGGALGYDLGNNFRIEGEATYRSVDLEKVSGKEAAFHTVSNGPFDLTGKLNVMRFILNGYYDIKLNAPVIPFVTGGFGIANIEIEDGRDAVADNVYAYQLGAGLGYILNDAITIDCGYKYMKAADPTFKEYGIEVNSEYSSHNFYVGLRYAIN